MKNMKNILYAAGVLVSLLVIFPSQTHAADPIANSELYFTPSPFNIEAGNTATTFVQLRLNPQKNPLLSANGVSAVEAHVRYDASKLSLVSISQSSGSFPALFPGGKKIDNVAGTSSLIVGNGTDPDTGDLNPPITTDSLVAIYGFKSISPVGTNTTSIITFSTLGEFTSIVADSGINVLSTSTRLSVVIFSNDTTPPTVTTFLPATNLTQTGVTISWNDSTDAGGVAGYQVFKDGVQIATSTTTSYPVTGLLANTLYTFTVKAFDNAGNVSLASAPLPVTTLPPPDAIAPVVTFVVNPNSSSLTVPFTSFSATDNSGIVTGYLVNEVATPPLASASGWTGTSPTSYVFGSSGVKTLYAWAKDATGNVGGASQPVTITLVPVITSSLTANGTVDSPFSYQIVASNIPTSYGATPLPPGLTLNASGLISGTSTTDVGSPFTVNMTATNLAGTGSKTLTITISPAGDTAKPPAPGGLHVDSVTTNIINLSWNTSVDTPVAGHLTSGVIGYRLLRNGVQIADQTGLSFSDTGRTPNTPYTYTVKAYDLAGNVSDPSTSVTGTTSPINLAPIVSAGSDQTIGVAQTVNLNGSASDDGLPVGSTLTTTWSKVSGPAVPIGFGDTSSKVTTASFPQQGIYTLRLTAFDGALSSFDDVVITVNPNPDTTDPTVIITEPQSNGTISGSVTVKATASDAGPGDQISSGVAGVQFSINGNPIGTEDTTSPYQVPLDTTTITNGTYQLVATVRDNVGRSASSSIPVIVSNPPVISNINASATNNSATISWDTLNSDSNSQVLYSVNDTSYNLSSAVDPIRRRNHQVVLSGLLSSKTYHFKVRSIDALGNVATSPTDSVFTTLAAPDTSKPIILSISTSLTQTSATITWRTNEPSTSKVNYGLTSAYGQFAIPTPNNLVTIHTVSFGGLAPNTTYNYSLESTDSSNNTNVPANRTFRTLATPVTPIPDTTAPTFDVPRVYDTSNSQVTILWNTNEQATGVVEYGPTTAYGSTEVINTVLQYSHAATLRGLTANIAYHYRVIGVDGAGNPATSNDYTFTTGNNNSSYEGTTDRLAPVISQITASPSSRTSALIKWTTNELSDSYIQFYTTITPQNSNSNSYQPYANGYENTVSVAEAMTDHNITITFPDLGSGIVYHYIVVSRDASGNVAASADQTFTTVEGADTTNPTTAITSPIQNALLRGTVPVNATASDNNGVLGVKFYADSINPAGLIGSESTVSPYGVTWNTATSSDGPHTIFSVARDAANNAGTSAGVLVRVDNAAPTVAITSPATSGSIVSGTLSLVAAASDNVAVADVQFYLDNPTTLIGGLDTAAPYTATLDTTTLSGGTHTLYAVARDTAGNKKEAAPVTINIDNSGPSIAFSTNATSPISGPFRLTMTTSRPVTGFDATDIQVTGGTSALFGSISSTVYGISIQPVTPGSITVAVPAGSFIDSSNLPNANASFTIVFDPAAPSLVSSTINGPTLVINFNKALATTSIPSTSDFLVLINSSSTTVSSISLSGTTANLSLVTAALNGNSVSFAYTPGINPIKSLAGVAISTSINSLVTNNTPSPVVAPPSNAPANPGNSGAPANPPQTPANPPANNPPASNGNAPGLVNSIVPLIAQTVAPGDKGAIVSVLQNFLAKKGLMNRPAVGGNYGPQTRAAVIAFQTKYGLPVTGIVDDTTLAKINEIIKVDSETFIRLTTDAARIVAPKLSRNLYQGLTGADVKALQIFLNNSGFIIANTGIGSKGKESNYFGQKTKQALQRWQNAAGITPASGLAGRLTIGLIKQLSN